MREESQPSFTLRRSGGRAAVEVGRRPSDARKRFEREPHAHITWVCNGAAQRCGGHTTAANAPFPLRIRVTPTITRISLQGQACCSCCTRTQKGGGGQQGGGKVGEPAQHAVRIRPHIRISGIGRSRAWGNGKKNDAAAGAAAASAAAAGAGGRGSPHISCLKVPLPPLYSSDTVCPTASLPTLSTRNLLEPRGTGGVAFTFASQVWFVSPTADSRPPYHTQ